MLIYIIGLGLAVGAARILRSTVLRGESAAFVMELPPYRMPSWLGLLKHTWRNAREYLQKAGTLILSVSIILWALSTYPRPTRPTPVLGLSPAQQHAENLSHSWAGRIGRTLEPVLQPIGFDWKLGTALLGAVAAKEIFVSQLAIVNAVGEEDTRSLREILRQQYTPLQGFCILLFMLIGWPCVATLAATRKESGHWRWAFYQVAGLTLLAYGLTLAVYQIGRIMGWGV
jgi:ferrous iron transport protein B